MTEAALHQLIIETMSAIRADLHNVRTDVQGLRAEIGTVRSEIDRVREDGSKRGRDLWDQTNRQGELLIRVDERTKKVEEQIADTKPTLSQYRKWQSRAEAAGWLGQKLWIVGGGLISAVVAIYAYWDRITHWLRIILGIKG
jgi:chromosome segregation ATPase